MGVFEPLQIRVDSNNARVPRVHLQPRCSSKQKLRVRKDGLELTVSESEPMGSAATWAPIEPTQRRVASAMEGVYISMKKIEVFS